MPLQVPDFEQLRARYLEALRNQNPQAAVAADSDAFVRASGVAASVESLHQHLWWLVRQLFPDTADDEYLVRLAGFYGLTAKPAAPATGSVRITGAIGKVLPAGSRWAPQGGAVYRTTAAAAVGQDGTGAAPVAAEIGGPAGNLAVGAALTLLDAVASINAAGQSMGISGGADRESSDSLRARLLAVMRNAPAGGTVADYERWAMEVPGVKRVSVFPLRRGVGTVDLVVMSDGLPTDGLRAAVLSHVNASRPVTADVQVLAPTLQPIPITAKVVLSGVSIPAVKAEAEAALAVYFASLPIGGTVYRSRISAAIQNLDGVVSVNLLTPAADVAPDGSAGLLTLATLGPVVLEL